jgi:ribosomal protein S18 acetylase RimI-like enzyme
VATIRRLGPDDTQVLETLAREAAEFDIEGRTESVPALEPDEARRLLSHPDILLWVAGQDRSVDGFLLCYVQYLWHAPARELMLYEIGVRSSERRKGIGRALVAAMENWMREQKIVDVWVPADNPGAVAFYNACGFTRDDEQPVMLSKQVG